MKERTIPWLRSLPKGSRTYKQETYVGTHTRVLPCARCSKEQGLQKEWDTVLALKGFTNLVQKEKSKQVPFSSTSENVLSTSLHKITAGPLLKRKASLFSECYLQPPALMETISYSLEALSNGCCSVLTSYLSFQKWD